ncbi:MAG: hypothetical protein L0Z50_20120, partial [Verrucomicrobiales bacterium]|nr:hypothetical protein [Verrucomicrobiales bacterium]
PVRSAPNVREGLKASMTFFQGTRCEPGRFAVRTEFAPLATISEDTDRLQIGATNHRCARQQIINRKS